MNKNIKIINNTLFIINAIVLFNFFRFLINFSFTKLSICAIILLILLVLTLIQIKKKNAILENKKYNSMFLFVNIVVLIIFLRALFDPMIPLNDITAFDFYSTGSMFIDYNIFFIAVMYGGVLIYNLINMERKEK